MRLENRPMTVSLAGDDDPEGCMRSVGENSEISHKAAAMNWKERRKALKKMKRKQVRRETAMREREEEEALLNDPEEQVRQRELEQAEAERMERDRKEFEERERRFIEELELKRKREEEEEEQRGLLEEEQRKQVEIENRNGVEEGSDWEYVEEGPAEIIWQGNEIIVRKKKVRVPKKDVDQQNTKEDNDRPISNPLAPQSEAFEEYKNAQELLESVAQQVPNFGTEQDKAHCPFHLKTGACRFGSRCSRVHFYPDKSCTLLMKNMYSGPGLAWEHDEGLEVEHCFEDFYEDVHTEFLKFGEIVNFKVCNNACTHLRGNVYVNYKSLESAVLAYHSINGRYFAGKQITCEFVNVTRWRVAICGEYMKSRLKTCSRGSACNFIHCFRNPGGDYEWADWDRPPPRYWVKKMAALFGYTDEYDKQSDEGSPGQTRSSTKRLHADAHSYHSRRSRSRERLTDHDESYYDDDVDWKTARRKRKKTNARSKRVDNLDGEIHEERMSSKAYPRIKRRKHDNDLDVDSNENHRFHAHSTKRSRKGKSDHGLMKRDGKSRAHDTDSDRDCSDVSGGTDSRHEHKSRRSKIINDHEDSTGKPRNIDTERSQSSPDIVQGRSIKRKRANSVHHDIDSDVSETDSQRDGHNRYEERHHSHSRRSTGWGKLSHGGSRGYSTDRDEDRYHKHGKRDSTPGKELSFSEVNSLGETSNRDGEEHCRRRTRSSRQKSKEHVFSDIDSHYGRFYKDKDRDRGRSRDGDRDRQHKKKKCTEVEHSLKIQGFEGNPPEHKGEYAEHADKGFKKGLEQEESEAEQDERAYRQAALEKLEEKRRLKDFPSADSHEKLGTHKPDVRDERVEDAKQFPNSKDVGHAISGMRRRI